MPRGKAATLSALAGMSAETFSSWRTGKRHPNPDLKELERIADALRVSPAYLISDENSPVSPDVLRKVEQAEQATAEAVAVVEALVAAQRALAEAARGKQLAPEGSRRSQPGRGPA
mgnify:CR=1 FL=1